MGLKTLRILLIVYAVLSLNKATYAQCPGGGAPQKIVKNISTSPDALVQNFTYPKFDPSLGTLIGVDINLVTTGFTMLQLVNGDGFDNNFTDMEFRRRDRLDIPGMGISVFNDVTENFPNQVLGASVAPTPMPPYSINPNYSNEWWGDATIPDNVAYSRSIPASGLSNYIGTTGTVVLQYSIIAQFSAIGVGSHYTMNVVTLATNISMTLTYTYCPNNVLANEPLDFQAAKKATNNILLTWTKQQEQDNILYTPEVSDNGISFTPIGSIQSQKPSNEQTAVRYEFPYELPANKNNKLYFRVKQLSPSGLVSYSAIRTIDPDKQPVSRLSIYPNPADKNITINFDKPQRQQLRLEMLSSAGQVVESAILNLAGGQIYTHNFSRKHATGVYFVKIRDASGGEQQVIRLLIK